MDLIGLDYVKMFANNAHKGQVRKYTGEDYVEHVYEVARLYGQYRVEPELDAYYAAILHDVVEDTDVTFDQLVTHFGEKVAEYVWYLTKPEDFVGNRKQRKALDGARLALAPDEVKFIKICDIMHNAPSIREHDPALWKTWRVEMYTLLTTFKAGSIWEKHACYACNNIFPQFIAELTDGL